MLKEGLSRRQFVGGTAALMGAAAMPTFANVSQSLAATSVKFPLATPGWTPLDPKAAARLGWEIHAGLYNNSAQPNFTGQQT